MVQEAYFLASFEKKEDVTQGQIEGANVESDLLSSPWTNFAFRRSRCKIFGAPCPGNPRLNFACACCLRPIHTPVLGLYID